MKKFVFSSLKIQTGLFKFLLAWLFYYHCNAQTTSYNFRHLTTNDGLSNGVIKSITQDKYGYMWMATASGVCMYNGYAVKVFLHADKDSFSTPDNNPIYILCDKNKNIWVSFENGLYQYNYSNSHFILQQKSQGITINKMVEGKPGILYCLTRNGIKLFNTKDGSFTLPEISSGNLFQQYISDISVTKNGIVYLASDTGFIVYQPAFKKAYLQTITAINNESIYKLSIDDNNNIWMSYGKDRNMILQTDSSFKHCSIYNDFLYGSSKMTGSQVTGLFTDNSNRVWAATSRSGICRFDSSSKKFISYFNNPQQAFSLSSFHVSTIFQSNDGFIWAGTGGYGINYFNPDNNLFHSIVPDNYASFTLSDRWYRVSAEDSEGNLWMGSMNGLVKYNKKSGTYKQWQNKKDSKDQLYSNSIRSLLCDNHGYIWIGTSDGLNRYNPLTKHIDFFGDKDSLPLSFFWTLLQDHTGNIWIGCRDGLYTFKYSTNKFEHFENDALLSAYRNYNVTSLFEDSRKRIWIGCYNKGVIMIDTKNNNLTHWMKDSNNVSFINNNIHSFTEDKKGIIWIATNDGLASYNNNEFKKYQIDEGLKTLDVCALLTDRNNRIWIGSGNGLFLLDSARKQFTSFTTKDGLLSAEFNEQSAFKTKQGIFIYPTLQGFVAFNPEDYKENNPARSAFISSVNVFNKKFTTAVNPEELKKLNLASNENFFSLELVSPDYNSPQRTWFAYKLEPLDKDWVYTKDRLVNYTNVPGGKYIFHYKASANKTKWNVPEKTIAINIATVFYHTNLFWFFVSILFILLVYGLYKYRLQQSKKIYALQNKAQLLEKEKAVVQYENLKQQLNPHFLFNSLTSLRSLIRIDKQSAADFLDKISINYRYILKSSESELVSVKDELEFVQTYIELQQTRFGKGLCVSIEANDESIHKKIVPVTIQNLIDNAIKHNSMDADNPLVIKIFTENNYLIVSNNLQLKENVETSNGHGLNYLISLYKYLDKRRLLIDKTKTHFTVKIPLI